MGTRQVLGPFCYLIFCFVLEVSMIRIRRRDMSTIISCSTIISAFCSIGSILRRTAGTKKYGR